MRAFERLWMAIEGWNVSYENLGLPGSIAGYRSRMGLRFGRAVPSVQVSASEGGVRVPMVISGPGIKNLGFVDGRCQVSDIAPTLLDVAGATYTPDEFYGRSLMPLLSGDTDAVYGETDPFAIEVSGTAALYRGNWKITKTPEPYGDGVWRLYDVLSDPGETTDVAEQHPSVFQQMQSEYRSYAKDVGVFEPPEGETARGRIAINAMKKFSVNYWCLVLATLVLLAAALYGLLRALTRTFARRPA